MAEHNILGKQGEDAAAHYLENNGYAIVARNWRYQRIEIDIIAINEDVIVFAEVKTRKTGHWGNPEEAINNNKIKRMVEAADFYVNENDIDLPVRFDVISIIANESGFEMTHIDDAFLSPLN